MPLQQLIDIFVYILNLDGSIRNFLDNIDR